MVNHFLLTAEIHNDTNEMKIKLRDLDMFKK